MPELTEPWDDPEAEREVLVDLIVPAAHAQYDQALHRWSALDAKAFGLLALVIAIIGGLAAVHDTVNPAWWAPAAGAAVAGGFFVHTIWQREVILGPDLIDYHDEMRAKDTLEAARLMVVSLSDATEDVDDGYADKAWSFQIGLAILSISLVGCLPILLLRP
jgi:hypothetical protein